jgi:hypothetical protein
LFLEGSLYILATLESRFDCSPLAALLFAPDELMLDRLVAGPVGVGGCWGAA